MTEKAILFARVSTEQQDLERQKEILIPKIKEDGFTDDDIIIIEHKESAIKNDFYSRDGIEELKEKIENEKIKAVYATELSRLGRRNDVILKVWGLLEEKKICLVIQSPTQFRTIDKDGKQSLTGSILMGIMQQVSISEMEIKKERMMSGIKLRKERGYLAVSRVKFGYKRDINNRAEIDEEKAEIVRQCFDLCLKGDSCGLIYKKFNYLAHWNSNTPNQKISKLLRDKTYIGENDVITYPRIIDDDTFYKVQEALKDRRLCKHKTKFTYYCQKLIHWNGRTFTPCYSNATYHLRLDKKVYSLSVNCLDAMTKNLAINAYAEISQMDAREERDSYLAMIDECDKKIEGIELGIRNIENKIFRFMEADFSDEEMIKKTEEKIKQLKAQKKKMVKDKENIEVTKKIATDNLTPMEDFSKLAENIDILNDITDDDKIVEIINKVIKSIELEKLDNGWRLRYIYHNLAYNKEMEDEFYDYIKPTLNKIEIYVNGLKQNEKGELVNAYYRLKQYEQFKRRINFVGRFKGKKNE